mgnify:FL=1
MKCYIYQSGKIENTRNLTVVAYSNGKSKSMKISAVEKRKLISIFKTLDHPNKVYIYKIFAGMIFLLTKDLKDTDIVIDREYPGQEPLIKDIIIKLFEKDNRISPNIHWELIGKANNAHITAIETFRGKLKADVVTNHKELITLFYGKKIGRSSHSR